MSLATAEPSTAGRHRATYRRARTFAWPWRLVLAAGVVLLVVGAAVTAVQWGRPQVGMPTAFGTDGARGDVLSTPTATPASAPASASATATPSATPTPSATSPAPPVTSNPAGPPSGVRIPSLGVDASVVDVLQIAGVIAVPDNPEIVGWWVGSAIAGSPTGSTVLVGHVDSATQGVGVLSALAEVEAGTQIVLTTTENRTIVYTVTAREVLSKTGGLPADLFAMDIPGRLVLITCGGPFDTRASSYEDNVVVYASLG